MAENVEKVAEFVESNIKPMSYDDCSNFYSDWSEKYEAVSRSFCRKAMTFSRLLPGHGEDWLGGLQECSPVLLCSRSCKGCRNPGLWCRDWPFGSGFGCKGLHKHTSSWWMSKNARTSEESKYNSMLIVVFLVTFANFRGSLKIDFAFTSLLSAVRKTSTRAWQWPLSLLTNLYPLRKALSTPWSWQASSVQVIFL